MKLEPGACVEMGFGRRPLLAAVTAAMAAAPMPGICHAAELIIAQLGQQGLQVDALRELSRVWEADTGHQLVWLTETDEEGDEVLDDIADVYIAPYAKARELAQADKLTELAPPIFESAPLLVDMVADGRTGNWLGAPLANFLPVIHYDQAHLAASGIAEVPPSPSWGQVFTMAASAADPVGEIHGFCASGWLHGTLIRSLLSDAKLAWLDPETGRPFAGASWHAQAQIYIRQLARSGPPNAASLTALELIDLFSKRRCALWLSPPGAVAGAPAMATPGSSAFASVDLLIAAVAKDSEQALLARGFTRWLATRKLEQLRESRQPRGPMDAMLMQQGSAQLPGQASWAQVDLRAQEALRKMVDGLVPVADALLEASQIEEEQ